MSCVPPWLDGVRAQEKPGRHPSLRRQFSGDRNALPMLRSMLTSRYVLPLARLSFAPFPSFPAQPQNSPTFPSQLSPYSQPFQLPYGSFGMGMSLTNFGTGMGTSYLGPSSVLAGGGHSHGVGGSSVTGGTGGVGGGGVGGGGGMSLGMSISPNYHHALHAMSQGSLQAASSLHNNAAGVGAERSRELEAKFVKDFTCCGLRLNGLHDLLEQ